MKRILLSWILCLSFFAAGPLASAETRRAIFAGGCFWCMQPPMDALKAKGVLKAVVGYSGGESENPTYKSVSAGGTGHLEVIEVTYDSKKISFKDLLQVFWINVDPFDPIGQFCDKGDHYKSAIFYSNESERKDIEESIKGLKEKGLDTAKISTQVLPVKKFTPAEEEHQSYYIKNPIRYKYYRTGCGRDKRLKEVWGQIKQSK